MKKKKFNSGFIGLLALLICFAIILFLMFGKNKKELKPAPNSNDESNQDDKSMVETQLNAVKKAREANQILEQRSYENNINDL